MLRLRVVCSIFGLTTLDDDHAIFVQNDARGTGLLLTVLNWTSSCCWLVDRALPVCKPKAAHLVLETFINDLVVKGGGKFLGPPVGSDAAE